MHCLGAVSGSDAAGPSGLAGRGGVMSVVRALGVLVCEGRLQGPPRGYKEGPHCAAPLQASPTDHVCEKDNYLCARYLVLVREIADRITIGSSLSVEVLMCADCPCGLARATCNPPSVTTLPTSASITQWQHPSDVLLEYWSISVIPSKSTEMMNPQGLYQAVRSRLHFSQVAAWWSRSNGTKPSYVTTRIVSHNDDNLRKFRESPIEHTFPLAGIGDGNSIEVTVWALPRMEEVPTLNCSLHPTKENDEECAARALTPTKNGPLPSSSSHSVENLVLPALVDDRLQTACDKPGKHHCHCEDEETSPPSPSIRPNGERKRRRSLPCGPSHETPSTSYLQLSSVCETIGNDKEDLSSRTTNYNRYIGGEERNYVAGTKNHNDAYENRSYLSTGSLERCFRKQVSLEEDGNEEKRYKPTIDNNFTKNETNNDPEEPLKIDRPMLKDEEIMKNCNNPNSNNDKMSDCQKMEDARDFSRCRDRSDEIRETIDCSSADKIFGNDPGGSSSSWSREKLSLKNSPPCTVHHNYPRLVTTSSSLRNSSNPLTVDKNDAKKNSPKELSELMAKLSFSKEKKCILTRDRRDSKFVDWFEKAPRRVDLPPCEDRKILTTHETPCNDGKLKNCHLELSQREFNEVLAVLRARTPTTTRRRTPSSVKTMKRRERDDSSSETKNRRDDKHFQLLESTVCPIHREKNDGNSSNDNCECRRNEEREKTLEKRENPSNKADILLAAILRTGRDRKGLADISNGTRPRNSTSQEQEPRGTTNFEDEKSLPNLLNKRLSRFRQLFEKELEKRKVLVNTSLQNFVTTSDGTEKVRAETEKKIFTPRRDRVKRKIDFTDFSRDTEKNDYQRFFDDSPSETHRNVSNSIKFTDDNQRPDRFPTINHATNAAWNTNNCRSRNNDSDDYYCEDDSTEKGVPSAVEQEQFRRSFENAASMVFHSRTGLPLTSSPAPLRRGHCCFDYDSTLNSVSSKRSALFELNTPPSPGAVSLEEADREIEIIGEGEKAPKRQSASRARPQSHGLLGSFEESALNGRLEPVSTVHGFTAELGASGSFCPKHRKLPVTVFFYTLGDNDKVSTPYLAHINLGKKGYQVPRSGTIQVTLLNPLGTVVKMFVVLYDLSDMPPRSHTFLRQRILRDKTLRYLVHLRFVSGKSGRIYLHTDIRMIICRKSDVDTASDFGSEPPKELRSYTHGPSDPKFSPRC